jgi:hypothetical protein
MSETDRICLFFLAGGLLFGAVGSVVFYALVAFVRF